MFPDPSIETNRGLCKGALNSGYRRADEIGLWIISVPIICTYQSPNKLTVDERLHGMRYSYKGWSTGVRRRSAFYTSKVMKMQSHTLRTFYNDPRQSIVTPLNRKTTHHWHRTLSHCRYTTIHDSQEATHWLYSSLTEYRFIQSDGNQKICHTIHVRLIFLNKFQHDNWTIPHRYHRSSLLNHVPIMTSGSFHKKQQI